MAELQIEQDITIPSDPPSSRDRVTFRIRADAFVAWMKAFATQINDLIPKLNTALTWINTNVQNALGYAQTATDQAGIATTKASAAAASAIAAYNAQIGAEAALDAFDDKYLGAKATAPTVDNDGNALVTGALYFKTTAPLKGLYVYDAELLTWSSPTYVPTSHSSLSERSDADAHPMSSITGLMNALGNDANFATTMTNALVGKQPKDATLTALANLTTAADKLIYATGVDAFATTALTAFARALLDDADAATMKTTLGIVDGIGVGQSLTTTALPLSATTTNIVNSTSKPMLLLVYAAGSSSATYLTLTVDGNVQGAAYFGTGASSAELFGIVMPGKTAQITTNNSFSVGSYTKLS